MPALRYREGSHFWFHWNFHLLSGVLKNGVLQLRQEECRELSSSVQLMHREQFTVNTSSMVPRL